jgi:hypothetical protein
VFNGESFVATAYNPGSDNGPLPDPRILKFAGCESGERGKRKATQGMRLSIYQ